MKTLPTALGPYWLIRQIGEGAFSEVFLAYKGGKGYLIKCLREDRAKHERAVDHFLREVRISTHVSHPNIVFFVDHGKIDNIYFAVMDLDVGLGLNIFMGEWLRAKKMIPLPLSLYIVRSVLSALTYLHETTAFKNSNSVLFHGDLSPDNILVTHEGEVKLMDFGSGGQESFSDTASLLYGKLAYLPYEVSQRKALSPATDIYSLGVISYFLLFGQKPFEGKGAAELLTAVQTQDVPHADASKVVKYRKEETKLRIFFNQALNKDPALRFKNADTFATAFFGIKFREEEASSPEEFLKHSDPTFVRALQNLRALWMKDLDTFAKDAANANVLIREPASVRVEDILAQEEVRSHPRVRMTDDRVKVDLATKDFKWRSTFGVVELSQGGLLMEWKALPTNTGSRYPIFLDLSDGKPVIPTIGEVRYEIAKANSIFAGVRFAEMSPDNSARLEKFVERKLKSVRLHQSLRIQSQLGPKEEVLEVFFRSTIEWRKECEQNVRHGGITVRTKKPYETGTKVAVRIHLPEGDKEFLFRGSVVYCWAIQSDVAETQRKHGVGIQLDLTVEQLKALSLSILKPGGETKS